MASVGKIVKQLREANREAYPTTLAFFEWASGVRNTPRETTFEELQATLKITKLEARQFAADIEEAGIGTRIFGRRGLKSRIRWIYTLPSVSKAARELSDTLEVASQTNFPAIREGNEKGASSDHPDDAEHFFRLRSNMRISFRLPRDLTTKEADRLAAYIRTLPIE
jgi:hypothetical protein